MSKMKKDRVFLRRNYHRIKPRRHHGVRGIKEAGIIKCPECNSSNTIVGLQGLKCKNCGVLVGEY